MGDTVTFGDEVTFDGDVEVGDQEKQDSIWMDFSVKRNEFTTMTLNSTPVNNMVFYGNGRKVLIVDMDKGTVEFGDGYKPDKAAKEFWDIVNEMGKNMR